MRAPAGSVDGDYQLQRVTCTSDAAFNSLSLLNGSLGCIQDDSTVCGIYTGTPSGGGGPELYQTEDTMKVCNEETTAVTFHIDWESTEG